MGPCKKRRHTRHGGGGAVFERPEPVPWGRAAMVVGVVRKDVRRRVNMEDFMIGGGESKGFWDF